MAKKIEELLPKILRDLSNGIAVSTVEIEKIHGLSASGVRSHLRTLEQKFYKGCFKYDGSTKKWVTTEPNFLNKILLKPEEVVVLNAMLRTKDRLGDSLVKWQENMVNNYVKRTSSFIFKQHISEEITEDMEQIFAQIHSAIDERKKLRFKLYGDYHYVVLPYKIINLEYYWYLLCFEESCEKEGANTQKIKSFTISKLRFLEILNEEFKHDFSDLEEKLEHAMNAFFSPDKPTITIELLVTESFTNYVERASFFSAWKKTTYTTVIKDIEYIRYEVKVTNPDFKEIIPTILKYLPNILAEEPIELKEKIEELINGYQGLYKF